MVAREGADAGGVGEVVVEADGAAGLVVGLGGEGWCFGGGWGG